MSQRIFVIILFFGLIFSLISSGASMPKTVIAQPKLGKDIQLAKVTPENQEIIDLVQDLTKYLHGKYSIKSSTFYLFSGDIPWVAISKNVKNQMAEKSISPVVFDWNNPGYDFVDVYPQGPSAFAVALSKKSSASKIKLVGYFVLTKI